MHAADYIHHNPIRRSLSATPDGWKWSSWKYYHQPENYGGTDLPRVHGFPA